MQIKQSQKGGKDSVNIQTGETTTVNIGISYSEARQIALDTFEANFYKLSGIASKVARERADKFIENYLTQLYDRDPSNLNSFGNPDQLYALFVAQREFAKFGDKDLGDILVDILVERANTDKRSLLQITLDEALKVVPKLTSAQWNALTILFLLNEVGFSGIESLSKFKSDFIEKYLCPYISNLPSGYYEYRHIVYSGCSTKTQFITLGALQQRFTTLFPALFSKGFKKEQFEEIIGVKDKFSEVLTPCINNDSLFQFNALDMEGINKILEKFAHDKNVLDKLKKLHETALMNRDELKNFLIQTHPSMEGFFSIWEKSPLNQFSLTSIGIVIANANLQRKTNDRLNLEEWIK